MGQLEGEGWPAGEAGMGGSKPVSTTVGAGTREETPRGHPSAEERVPGRRQTRRAGSSRTGAAAVSRVDSTS